MSRKKTMKGSMNIFISHIHKDDAGLKKLKALVRNSGLVVRDGSINKTNPNKAKDANYILNTIIRPRIRWCSVMVVYITPETRNSAWVDKEIMRAARLGKRIVGVWARGHEGCKPPDNLTKLADAIVGWQGRRIVNALRGKFSKREASDSSVCEPIPFKRVSC